MLAGPPAPLAPWRRLSLRLAAVFALATLVAIAVVGGMVYERQRVELEDTVGTQLLNIARTAALLVDPDLHAEIARTGALETPAPARLRQLLAAVQEEVLLPTPIRTLVDYDAARGEARLVVASDGSGRPGDRHPIPPELRQAVAWTLEDGVARYTRIYRMGEGQQISAVAPIVDPRGAVIGLLDLDYPVDVYLDRLAALRAAVIHAALAGGVGALLLGFWFARRLTRPIVALTGAAGRVAGGDLTAALPVVSHDEIGRLTGAFNEMVAGLRQRDLIRSAFGRYVSPEVAEALLDAPDGLRLGGARREVTVLMSDLRGYTRFAEQGEPEEVMSVLNEYLGRMAAIIIAHGGTINEFIGDAIFAVFGAPLDQPDHAERAAAAALSMQAAMADVNARLRARGVSPFEMGIGVNTGDAVVGNIGSEQRTKYAVVGSAVNVAARVEAATVGGQIYLTAATWARIRDLAEVGGPVEVQVKGVAAPLVLYELCGLRGRFARRLEVVPAPTTGVAAVEIPVECWIVDGKQVRAEGISGVTRRLALDHVDAALESNVPSFTNVLLRLRYPGAVTSGDLYGKVVAADRRDGTPLVTIRFTSVDPPDRARLSALLRETPAVAG